MITGEKKPSWIASSCARSADATVRFTALQSGDVDIIERTPYEWVQQIIEGKIKGIGYAKANIAGARNLEFNAADPPFNNKKLRLAIAYALDKQEIMQAAYFGLAETARSEISQRKHLVF